MTHDLEREVESRLTALETKVEEIKKLIDNRSNVLLNFFSSAGGGIVVGVVLWWITKK